MTKLSFCCRILCCLWAFTFSGDAPDVKPESTVPKASEEEATPSSDPLEEKEELSEPERSEEEAIAALDFVARLKIATKSIKRAEKNIHDYYNHVKDDKDRSIVLGSGSFGTVYLMSLKKDPEQQFAVKFISKSGHDDTDAWDVRQLKLERTLTMALKYPFIMKLRESFEDENRYYLVTEYVQGQTLEGILEGGSFRPIRSSQSVSTAISHGRKKSRRFETPDFDELKGYFDLPCMAFYVPQIVGAIAHLHKQQIIYRDMKPDNIMLNSLGFIKLVDLGMAKRLKKKGKRTNTWCGTEIYMAPEVYLSGTRGYGKGYDFTADWFTVGLVVLEMAVGLIQHRSLRYTSAKDFIDFRQKKIKSQLERLRSISGNEEHHNLFSFVEKLLEADPERRLGFNEDKEVLDHPYLSSKPVERIMKERNDVKSGALDFEKSRGYKCLQLMNGGKALDSSDLKKNRAGVSTRFFQTIYKRNKGMRA